MAPSADIDLDAPFERDIILQVRSSKMKTMPGLTIQSGIDKTLRDGPIPVTSLGIEDDEHDPVFHGGIDKAIHGYCSSHYTKWRAEFPEAASRFQPGGFGENLVASHMNERNVCIGDTHSIGDPQAGLLLQVSLPRQPCFKLNHRFQLKNFAPKTYTLSRTGWYYRVLREGPLEAGMEIRLVSRPHPTWTIERLQEFLHRDTDNAAMNEELSEIEEMGDECRGAFKKRVAKQKAREKKEKQGKAAEGEKGEGEGEVWKEYKIVERTRQTHRVTSLTLEALTPDPEASGSLYGSHARLKLPSGLLRSYSIVSGNPNRFELGIALESASRGGSSYLHSSAKVDDILPVGRLTPAIKPAGRASNHVFIVGGIGITAFLPLLEVYREIHWNTTLHYGIRSSSDIPFLSRIDALQTPDSSVRVLLYDASLGQRMDVPNIFKDLSWNTHVYVCGPRGMLDEAVREARAQGLGEDEVHFEAFSADTTGDPFSVEITNRAGTCFQVGGEETLLEVLRKNLGATDVPSSCEVGNCGTCKVVLKSGRVEHRGTALMDDEKEGAMLSCVSRGVGRIAIEI
ncbi:MOSC domain-containing protein [Xylariales sp. AK1849]|nr:MOSC domain-containing protein [Xylariales sp. AK1849]